MPAPTLGKWIKRWDWNESSRSEWYHYYTIGVHSKREYI